MLKLPLLGLSKLLLHAGRKHCHGLAEDRHASRCSHAYACVTCACVQVRHMEALHQAKGGLACSFTDLALIHAASICHLAEC